ncbi:MAG: hypothetical protein AB1641_26790 [Thermodesulfobacteriota bacterium]
MTTALQRKTVFLIDAEEYLARLLTLLLSPHNADLRKVNPVDLERGPSPMAGADGAAVIVSLPQPGQSSQKLVSLTKQTFPGLPLIELVPRGEANPEPTPAGIDQASHRFFKPLAEPKDFIHALTRALRQTQSPTTR